MKMKNMHVRSLAIKRVSHPTSSSGAQRSTRRHKPRPNPDCKALRVQHLFPAMRTLGDPRTRINRMNTEVTEIWRVLREILCANLVSRPATIWRI